MLTANNQTQEYTDLCLFLDSGRRSTAPFRLVLPGQCVSLVYDPNTHREKANDDTCREPDGDDTSDDVLELM